MNDKLISEIFRKHFKKEAAADGDDALNGADTIAQMATSVWAIGYPALRDVFAQRVQLPKGKTVHVVPVPTPQTAGATWAENVSFVPMTYISVTADQTTSLNFGWNHEYLLMATFDAVSAQMSELGRSLEQAEFKYCIDILATDADSGKDSITDPTTYALFVAGILMVNKDDFNCDTCIVSIETYFALLQDDSFVNVSVMGSADPIKSGRIATTLGVTVFASSVLASGEAVFFDSTKALCLVEVVDRITEEYAYPDQNLYGVVARSWYGAKVILPKAVACTAALDT